MKAVSSGTIQIAGSRASRAVKSRMPSLAGFLVAAGTRGGALSADENGLKWRHFAWLFPESARRMLWGAQFISAPVRRERGGREKSRHKVAAAGKGLKAWGAG
jgi:hypothetical protein